MGFVIHAFSLLVLILILGGQSVLISQSFSEQYLRFLDEQYADLAKTGDIVHINGTVVSLINRDMQLSLALTGTGVKGDDWTILDTIPGESVFLPASESVPYQFKVKLTKPGTFLLKSSVDILEVENSTITGLPLTIVGEGGKISVEDRNSSSAIVSYLYVVLPATGIAVAALAFLFRWKKRKKE